MHSEHAPPRLFPASAMSQRRPPAERSDIAWALMVLATSVALGFTIARWGPGAAVLPLAAGAGIAAIGLVLRRPTVAALAALALMSVAPIARVELGPVPLYLMDGLLATALVAVALRGGTTALGPVRLLVLAYLVAWLPAWLFEVLALNRPLEPTYGLLRHGLAVLSVFVGAYLVRERSRLEAALGVIARGVSVTCALTVLQVVPGTSGAVRQFLTQAAPAFAEAGYRVYPQRAFALFTAPTTLAGFLAVIAPLLVASATYLQGRRRVVVVVALALLGPALVATYSRAWVAGAAASLVVMAISAPRLFRNALVAAAVVGSFAWAGLAVGAIDSRYLSRRFSTFGVEDPNAQIRLERELQFFEQAKERPGSIVIGRGFAGQDLVQRRLVDTGTGEYLREGGSENSFLLEAFEHGLLAAVLLVVVMIVTLWRGIRAATRPSRDRVLMAGLCGSVAAAVVLHLENYFSQAVFMRAWFWLLVGMTLGLSAALLGERLGRRAE